MREGQKVNFKLTGKWELATKAIESMPSKLKEAYRQSQRNYGDKLRRVVRNHIIAQDLPWKDLSSATIKRKGHQEIYQDSLDYYNAIRVYSSGPYRISVGVKPNDVNQKGVNIAMYAAVNEFGHRFEGSNRYVPKRPLWAPSVKDLGGKQGLAESVAGNFNRLCKQDGTSPYIVVRKTMSEFKNK